MVLLKADKSPEGNEWMYQLKHDGYRGIAYKAGGKLYLRSRNDNDFSSRYPAIAKALSALPNETAVDGEIVAFNESGKPSFNTLQNHGSSGVPLLYFVVDVMILAGRDVTKLPVVIKTPAPSRIKSFRIMRKLLASECDYGSVRHAGVPAGISDRATPSGNGGSRSSTTTCRVQAQTAAPQAESIRSPVLGGRSSDLDELSEALILVKPDTVVSWHRAGYRLFWRWRSRRQRVGPAEGGGRSPRLDPSHEKRESDLGRATDPWRAAIPRVRGLRTYGVTLSATPKAHSGGKQSQPVARFSEQRSRGDCRLRLLHCVDPSVPHLILLLRDRTRSPAHSAL